MTTVARADSSDSSSDSGEELVPVRKPLVQRLVRRNAPRPLADDYDPHSLQTYGDLDYLGRRPRKKAESPVPEAVATLPTPLLVEAAVIKEESKPLPFLISPTDTHSHALQAHLGGSKSQPKLVPEDNYWVRHGSAEVKFRPKQLFSLPSSHKPGRVLETSHPRKRRTVIKKAAPLAVNKVQDLMGAYLGSARSARMLRTSGGFRQRA